VKKNFILLPIIILLAAGCHPQPPTQSASPLNPATSQTGTAQPQDTRTTTKGLALYPDNLINSLPTEAIPVKYLIEHRSALNGKTIQVKGIVADTIFGTDAQPSIIIADSNAANRDKNYDLRIGLNETDQNYTIGQTVVVKGVIDGSRVSVFMRKVY